MHGDAPVAVAAAGWVFSVLTAGALTGGWTTSAALARRTAWTWWYLPPAVVAAWSAASVVLLPVTTARLLCLGAAVLACGVFVLARPRFTRSPDPGRHSNHRRDAHEPLRLALLAAAVLMYGGAVAAAIAATQA